MSGVVTCSALRKTYRDILLYGDINKDTPTSPPTAVFILPHGDQAILHTRMEQRQGHFMPATLLQSQLRTLEMPDSSEHCLVVNIDNNVDSIVSEIIEKLNESIWLCVCYKLYWAKYIRCSIVSLLASCQKWFWTCQKLHEYQKDFNETS